MVDTFCLVCLTVEEVDHLSLAKNVRHRYVRGEGSEAGEAWQVQNVNP